jgi:hypothetical protein
MKYVIDFYNHVDELVIDQYLIDNNITKIKQLESFGKVYLVESENEIVITDLIENLSADADQPVNLLSFSIDLVDNYTETSFDIEDEKNWWKVATINQIDFDQPTHTHKIRGANSTVYIIDSGITVDHPEFANANIELLHTFNGNFADNNGHGTGLSSLIVGPTCGLANPRLKVVKLFDNTQPTYQSDMLIALDAVLNDFVTNGKKASVVNMSWAIPKNEYVNNKIQFMINQGMYVVAAAGNNGAPITDVTPASIPDVLTIGSFNQNLEPSAFSNYTGGSDISYTANDVNYGALDGWAPGELIWAANKNGGYGYVAGTSAAAAIASAAIAYNINTVLTNTGSVNDKLIIDDMTTAYKNGIAYFRPGVLNLSNPLYSNSVNKIVTIFTSVTFREFYSFIREARAEVISHFSLAKPITVASISSITPLPEYFTISSDGYISINYPPMTEEYIVLPDLELIYNNKDGSKSTIIIRYFVVNNQYDSMNALYVDNPDAFIGDDFALQYTLSDDDYCSTNPNLTCANNGCTTDPGIFQPSLCENPSKSSEGCTCTPQY